MTQKEKDKMVAKVLTDFDFGTVEMVMKTLGWGWADCGDQIVPPGINELATEARKMLYEVLQNENGITYILRGGFCASWNGKVLQLDFVLTTSDYHYNNK